jgi:hypothetical protein
MKEERAGKGKNHLNEEKEWALADAKTYKTFLAHKLSYAYKGFDDPRWKTPYIFRSLMPFKVSLQCGWEYKLLQPRYTIIWRYLLKSTYKCSMTKNLYF